MSMPVVNRPFEALPPLRPAGIEYVTRNMIRVALIGSLMFTLMAAGLVAGPDGMHSRAVQRIGVVGLLALVLPAAVLAYGLLRSRRWTRPLLLVFHTAAAVSPFAMVLSVSLVHVSALVVLAVLAGMAAVGGAVWWYLYRKPNVVAWFNSLPRGR